MSDVSSRVVRVGHSGTPSGVPTLNAPVRWSFPATAGNDHRLATLPVALQLQSLEKCPISNWPQTSCSLALESWTRGNTVSPNRRVGPSSVADYCGGWRHPAYSNYGLCRSGAPTGRLTDFPWDQEVRAWIHFTSDQRNRRIKGTSVGAGPGRGFSIALQRGVLCRFWIHGRTGAKTTRSPQGPSQFSGFIPPREVDPHVSAALPYQPPRITRHEPDARPVGSVTVPPG